MLKLCLLFPHQTPDNWDVLKLCLYQPEIKGIVLTHPNYLGFGAEIAEIADFAKQHALTLIVDEAHGAHLNFCPPDYPQAAERFSADVIVQSTHKTLSSLTQSALLHINTDTIDVRRLDFFLRVYQTTSPSYLLMNALEEAVLYAEEHARSIFSSMIDWHKEAVETINQTTPFYVRPRSETYDYTKLIVQTTQAGFGGYEVEQYLNTQNIVIEYASDNYILAMLGIGSRAEDLQALAMALGGLSQRREKDEFRKALPVPQAILAMHEAFRLQAEEVDLAASCGRISADLIVPYPPGIPLLLPGEKIDAEIISSIAASAAAGAVIGIKENRILVTK